MPRRRILIGALLLAFVLLAGYGLLWWYFAPPASAINRANALKIKPGMTLAEVEAILGGPARDELGGTDVRSWGPSLVHEREVDWRFWRTRYRWGVSLEEVMEVQRALNQVTHGDKSWQNCLIRRWISSD